jgi:hypothetical protein
LASEYILSVNNYFFKTFDFEEISIRNHGTMTVTNQENIREFNGRSIHVHAGGRLSAVNLHVNAINVTVDTLAVFEATLAGQNFELPGMYNFEKAPDFNFD